MNKTPWYTIFIFFGFLLALIMILGLANLFTAKDSPNTSNKIIANGSTNPIASGSAKQQTTPIVALAKIEVVKLTKVSQDQIRLISEEEVEWPNGSLGCPVPGFFYTQAIVPGYKLVLQVGSEQFVFHTDKNKDVILCRTQQVELY